MEPARNCKLMTLGWMVIVVRTAYGTDDKGKSLLVKWAYVKKGTVHLDTTDGVCMAKCLWKLCRSKDNGVLIMRRTLLFACNVLVLRVLWSAPESARGKLGHSSSMAIGNSRLRFQNDQTT